MDDEDRSRCEELRRQVELFCVKHRPLILSYIKKYATLPEADPEDVYQEIVSYLWRKVPKDYRFESFNGVFKYCKKCTYWYIKRLSRINALSLDRRAKSMLKAPPKLGNSVTHESEDYINLFLVVEHLEKYIKTERERQILDLILQHYNISEAAKELGLSHETVRKYIIKFRKYLTNDV